MIHGSLYELILWNVIEITGQIGPQNSIEGGSLSPSKNCIN